MTHSEQHPVDLLPWYVNGTLENEERQQVERHLQQCDKCRNETELLRAMRDVAREEPDSVPGQFAWQRLRRDMHQSETTATAPAGRRWWLPSLATAAALIIVAQSVVLFNYTTQQSQPGDFVPAGQQLQGAVVQVKFNPDATEKDIRTALQAVNAEIITGPGASGVYRLRLTDGGDKQEVQARIDQLRANADVFDYIQRD